VTHRIALIGLGKIATDRHLPTIAADPGFTLAGIADPRPDLGELGVPAFATWQEMFSAIPDIDAVAICTPPPVRQAIAGAVLEAGKHVLLEKPPTATLSGLTALQTIATRHGRVLFTAWHSQHNTTVAEARRLLAEETVAELEVVWKEDVRKWHPGQRWIWQPGGFGVFDTGINALSILSRILPGALAVRAAELLVPGNADTPIAARIEFDVGAHGGKGTADFDWRPSPDLREISVTTQSGRCLRLTASGAQLSVDGAPIITETRAEYARLYRHFAALLDAGTSDVDAEPLVLAADALQIGRRVIVDAFDDPG
jgi:D-galactose 1-dehydrogenase